MLAILHPCHSQEVGRPALAWLVPLAVQGVDHVADPVAGGFLFVFLHRTNTSSSSAGKSSTSL